MTQSGRGQGNEPQPPAAPPPGRPWGEPWGPGAQRSPLPPEVPPQPPVPPAHPPAAGPGDAEATQYLPPVGGTGAPLPPASAPGDGEATRYLPPVGGEIPHISGMPGPMPGAPAGAFAEDATQLLPPQGGEATQYLPPVGSPAGAPPAAGDRPPPAEFDGLFRASEPTRQLPPVPARSAPPAGPPLPPVPGPAAGPGPKPKRSRTKVLIGAGVAGCAVAGLAVGALLSGGGGDKGGQPGSPQAAVNAEPGSTPSASASAKKPADPAEGQAKALDALLKDSGNSRDTVIKAVDSTRSCKDLGRSAGDLRTAANDRNALVTRLGKTAVDKLPGHDELSAQLTKAWQSSAAADGHYASWADQAGRKHGCAKDRARPTRDSSAGDKASGDATAAKKKAADLWNPIAKKYGLPQRQWTQL